MHVLPFHPASSDRGFSVVDYDAVEPTFGTWDDVAALAAGRRLMADAVLNHMSAESDWFRSFLAGEPPYDRFFRTVDPDADLSSGRAAAHAAAGDDVRRRRRSGPRVDHVLRRPGRPRLPQPRRAAGRARRPAALPRRRRHRDPARRDRLPLEGRGLAVDQPARDARPDRAAARRGSTRSIRA